MISFFCCGIVEIEIEGFIKGRVEDNTRPMPKETTDIGLVFNYE